MADFRSRTHGLTRGRFRATFRAVSAILACCTLVGGSALAGCASQQAAARPTLPQQPQAPLHDCDDGSTDPLWSDVKDATPKSPGTNNTVVFPPNVMMGKTPYGYAIRGGDRGGDVPLKETNWLAVTTTIREMGIECYLIWGQDALNLFHHAFAEVGNYEACDPKTTRWALGVNSKGGRAFNQIHIHMTCLKPAVWTELLGEEKSITSNYDQWMTAAPIVIKDSNKGGKEMPFRAVYLQNLSDHNLFRQLEESLKNDAEMQYQMLLVAPAGKNGIIVLNSADDFDVGKTKYHGIGHIDDFVTF